MPKTPPGPGESLVNKTVVAKGEAKQITAMRFQVEGEPTKNYVLAPMVGELPKPIPLLLGANGKLYVRKDLVPDGIKGFIITVTEVR